ncbi:AAA family ATPase [Dactylosporangium roseum]|uniref:AAA family ATPase n=1 Tax=Dactylosporangium roseum TaxID=47989 RepID=A0ABY5YX40_9ACTN|nr:AAA family ATPase [Dactylosporangium roseum]UWZ34097.1 AAA family ATPase [Dactylosporangium roseum]
MTVLKTFGRDRELATLHTAVAGATNGVGGCTVLTGSPGIGKSHLLRAAVDHAEGLGVVVAARAAFELDRAAPLVTLASALRQLRPVTDAFAWLREDHDNQYRAVERLGAALDDFTDDRPLVIVIDDAQWMDELSALAIRELVPALRTVPVRWLFARRPAPGDTPGQQVVDWLIREGADDLRLGSLDDLAVARLCAEAVGAEVDNTVLALAGGCHGIPLQVEQLLRALQATDQLVISGGVATVVGDELPSSFITIVEQVLRGLSGDARLLLRAGSVFGRPFSIEAVARLIGARPATLLPRIEEAVTAKVLVDVDDGLTFVHDLVRLAIYGTLGDSVGALLHREAAAVTRDEGRSPVEVAGHLLRSGRSGTREAVTMLHEAAKEVAGPAPATAADLIVHALDVLGEHDPARVALVADAVGLLASASRLEQAHELGETALRAGLPAATEATLLLGLAEAFKHAGQNRRAVEYADRGLRHAEIPEPVRANLFAVRAHALFYVGDLGGADRAGASAYTSGQTAAEHSASVFGLTARSLVAQAQGRPADALAHAQEATDLADRVGGPAAHRHPRIWLGDALTTLDRFDEAEEVFRRGRQESEQLGTAWSTPLWHYYRTALLTARGRLDEAVAEAENGVAVADQVTAVAVALPLLGQLVRLAVMRGDDPQAREYLARMHRRTETGATAAPEDVVWPEGFLRGCLDGPDAAMRVLAGTYDALPDRPVLIGQHPCAAATLVRFALDAGDRSRAQLVATTARRLADRNPSAHSLVAAAFHAEGLLHRDQHRLEEAVAAFRKTRRPLALAGALEDAGEVREALDIATGCGAHRMRLRLAGEHPAADPSPFRAGSCLAQLTPAELKVAMLVAAGHKNRQVAEELFVSRHTVDSHLRKIFTKLDISSRVELANLVARER